MKKVDILGWIILISIIGLTFMLNFKLEQIRNDIKNNQVPNLTITDNSQFERLCKNLAEQWDAKDYVVYILQPNSSAKTHKELATKSINIDLPIRLEISNYSKLYERKTYFFGSDFSDFINANVQEYRDFILVPIFKHNIIVAEFILFYDKELVDENFESKTLEAQSISTLLR